MTLYPSTPTIKNGRHNKTNLPHVREENSTAYSYEPSAILFQSKTKKMTINYYDYVYYS